MAANTQAFGEQKRSDSNQSSATDKIQKQKNIPYQAAKSIGFPEKIQEMRHIRITSFKYDRKDRRKRLSVYADAEGHHKTILLPIPAELQFNSDGIYNMEGMLSTTTFNGATTDPLKTLANVGGEGLKKKFADLGKQAADTAGVGAQLSAETGMQVNPKTELTYSGNQLRQYTFTFTLVPKNEEEARQIIHIKRFFQRSVFSPTRQGETDSTLLLYPPMFVIGFIDENGKEMKSLSFIMPSHLTNVQIQENPHGQPTFIKGERGVYPSATSMTISFQEGRMLDQQDFYDWEAS